MIISRTPLRISFVGGGSDIASYYKYDPGAVVTTAINKFIYIAVNKQFDGRILINYSKTEIVKSIENIENNLVREALRITGIKNGIHITSIADFPSEGTGMGSSSSYVVGLLHALYAYQGRYVSSEKLAKLACKIEIEKLHKPIGRQDQYIAAYGGFQFMRFNADDSVDVDPIICRPKVKQELAGKLLLFYTGYTRSADPILAKQSQNMNTQIIKRDMMRKMVNIAVEMRKSLRLNKLDSFGDLLHENWTLKKQMADGVSNSQINIWYDMARKHGALGGKLLGAGGGGFLLFYAHQENHNRIKTALSKLKFQEFQFEKQGSQIIFVS